MTSPDGNLTVIFNGELYNYIEVRQELISLGYEFLSTSDTEVLLTAYRQWGQECVRRFNGMFAFLIHDRQNHKLFGARDRLGVKPFYFWQNAEWLVLASEPKAIGATGLLKLTPDWARLADSIRWDLMDHGRGTCLSGIQSLPAGHTVNIDASGHVNLQRYWELPQEITEPSRKSESDWIEELGALVTDAVRIRLRSDVPIGFTLSGGIDSSTLICEAACLSAKEMNLLAFSYQDTNHDERVPIADTVAQTRARLINMDDTQLDVAELLPKVVAANFEPIHSTSAIANYGLFSLASQHGIKVILGGQGADESLGGYRNYQWDYWHTLFSNHQWGALFADVRAFSHLHGRGILGTWLSTVARSLRIVLSGSTLYQHLRAYRNPPLRTTDIHRLFAPEFLHLATPPDVDPGHFRLAGAQRQSVTTWPLPMYLRIEDRVSMANSVEARLPFTDYRLVEHAFRMPDSLKYTGGLNKRALRQVAARTVPASVTSRVQKLGFPVSDSAATANQLHTLCKTLTESRCFAERGIYDHAAIARLLARSPQAQDVDSLFRLAQTELWLSGLATSGYSR